MLYGLTVDSPSIFLKLIARFIESIGAVQDFLRLSRPASLKQGDNKHETKKTAQQSRPSDTVEAV